MLEPHALLLALALSQEAPPPAAPVQEPPPAAAPAAAPPLAAPADGGARPAPVEAAPPPRSRGADEVQRTVKRLPELTPPERQKALDALQAEFGGAESSPVLPPGDLELGPYLGLPPADQARVTARHFVGALIAADASGLLAHCGFPFHLEDHRVDRAEDLRADWIRSLKAKRTDLLMLLDLEVLTPAEMEKKHGPPPRRLASWSWRAPGALLAVANLSGHAVVLLLRPMGAAWQVVAYHD